MNAHNRPPKIAACCIALALSCCANFALAQSGGEPTATVKVTPDRIEPGGSVTISGTGYVSNGLTLIITVTRPDGVKTPLRAIPDAQGKYSTPYIGAPAKGDYAVTAQVGEKGVPGTAHFTVESNAIDIDEDVADNQKFLDESRELTKKVKAAVDNTPDSPAKTQMETKLGTLETKLDQVSQQSARLTSMLAPVKALLAQRPEAQPALQPMLDHLDRLDEQTRQRGAAVVKATADLQRILKTCDSIDQAIRALQAVSDALDLFRRPFEFVSAYVGDMAKARLPAESGAAVDVATKAAGLAYGMREANEEKAEKVQGAMLETAGTTAENEIELGSETAIADKLVEAIPESIRNSDGYKLAVTEIKKFAPRVIGDAANPVKLAADAASLVTDIASYGEKKYFAQYCEKFEGPFTATMAAYFYAKDFKNDWWHYTITIRGTLSLRYPKDAGNGSVPLTGEFKGGATKFTYNESVWKNSNLFKIAGGNLGLVGTKDTAPIATDPGNGGVLASLLSPTSFDVPVSGHYANGKVDFKPEDARADFDPAYTRGNTWYVVISPYTLMLPVISGFTLPYQNAHFLLGHFELNYPVTQIGESMLVEAHEKKSFPRLPGNTADYTLDLKLCNPACGAGKE